jgi:positive regulator of sigma E activity
MRQPIFRLLGGLVGLFFMVVGVWMFTELKGGSFLDLSASLVGIVIGVLLLRYSVTGNTRITKPRESGHPRE